MFTMVIVIAHSCAPLAIILTGKHNCQGSLPVDVYLLLFWQIESCEEKAQNCREKPTCIMICNSVSQILNLYFKHYFSMCFHHVLSFIFKNILAMHYNKGSM